MQIQCKNIILRDYRESDIDDEVRWNTVETAWALWDGPWEMEERLANYNEEEDRRELRKFLEKPKEGHRWTFEIDTVEGVHIGAVNAYCIDEEYNWQERPPKEAWKTARWAVGIDISESSYWSGGYGTQALTAFVRYCVEDGFTELYTQTWSGNERMIGLAHKLGFRECCRKKDFRKVRGGVYDGLSFRLDLDAFSAHCAKLDAQSEELELHIPTVEDMWFTQALQEDAETMSYNAGWDISFDGYHPDTGCIDFPCDNWAEKHGQWVGKEPERFYAFVRERKSGRFVCEVNYHYTPENNWWDMGVLVYAPYRGRGYGLRSLELLLYRAFVVDKIERLHNDFEDTRSAALAIHRKAGFREAGESRVTRFGKTVRVVDLLLTREDYLALHPEYRS